MTLLSENEFFKNEFDPENKTLISTVKRASEGMKDERYRTEIQALCRHLEDKKPENVIGNMKQMFFTITPDTQEWLGQTLFASYIKFGVRKLALVESEEFFTTVSIEQTLEETKDLPFEVRYFKNIEQGLEWLKE